MQQAQGRAPSDGAWLGVLANPMSGRDIRRLVAKASVFPTAEKANMIQRILTAAAVVGVPKVLLSTDVGGISAAVLRAVESHRHGSQRHKSWPQIEFVELPAHSQTATDTTATVREMVRRGVRVILCLGGDGTARVVAAACGDVPMLPLSTGTNNAFPQMREATIAGLAASLLATGLVDPETGTRRATTLLVRLSTERGEVVENALVDVAVARHSDVASRALWDPRALTELYATFAEPDGIGLSSIPGLICPSPRDDPNGVALRLAPAEQARAVVQAPIAPGLIAEVGVETWRALAVGERHEITTASGVIAVDGERELAFSTHRTGRAPPTVELSDQGPRVVDIAAVMSAAARQGLLTQSQEPVNHLEEK